MDSDHIIVIFNYHLLLIRTYLLTIKICNFNKFLANHKNPCSIL